MIIHNEANSSCLVYIGMTNHSYELMNETFHQELIQFILSFFLGVSYKSFYYKLS